MSRSRLTREMGRLLMGESDPAAEAMGEVADSDLALGWSEPTRQAEISYAVFCLKKKKSKREKQNSNYEC